MNTAQKIKAMKSFQKNEKWIELVAETNKEIEGIEKMLTEESVSSEEPKFSSHDLAREVIRRMIVMTNTVEEKLEGVNGLELILERIVEAVVAWKNGLFYNDGLDFKSEHSSHDIDRKFRHILWCLTVMPEQILIDLEKEQLKEDEMKAVGEVTEYEDLLQ